MGRARAARGGRHARPLDARARRIRSDVLWIAPVLVGGGVVSFVNLQGAPARTADDSGVIGHVWSLLDPGRPADAWFGAGSAAWLQLTGYVRLTGALQRHGDVVLATREAMVVFSLVAAVLLWTLLRRTGARPMFAALGCTLFLVSPVALDVHRVVTAEGVAVPWLLGALLAATARRASATTWAVTGVCAGIAVLCSPIALLALPVVAWVLLARTMVGSRVGAAVVAGCTVVLVVGIALITGLVAAILAGGGADPLQAAGQTPAETLPWRLDPVGCVIGVAAAIVGATLPKLRAFSLGVLLVLAVPALLRGPVPSGAIGMALPFVVLLVIGLTETAIGVWRGDVALLARRTPRRGVLPVIRGVAVAWALAATGALVAAVPVWGGTLHTALGTDLNRTQQQAVEWLDGNVDHDAVVIVDPAIWLDLSARGWPHVYPTDPRPGTAGAVADWTDAAVVVVAADQARTPHSSIQASLAIDNSVSVAAFGAGAERLDIRTVLPAGLTAAQPTLASAQARRAQLGTQLTQNARLKMPVPGAELAVEGMVDTRILLVLASASSAAPIEVGGFPEVTGEQDHPRREVLVRSIDGVPTVRAQQLSDSAIALVASLSGDYRPFAARATADGLLLVYSPDPRS